MQHGIEFVVARIISKQYLGNLSSCLEKRCVYNTIRYVEQPVDSPESLLVFFVLSDILLEYLFTLAHLLQKSHHINDTKKASVSSNPSDLQTLRWTIYDYPNCSKGVRMGY